MKFDKENATRAFTTLFQAGQTVEIRVPKARQLRTISGYFDNMEDAILALEEVAEGKYEGIYWTLNEVNPALQARANNQLKPYSEHLTDDQQIVRRRYLLIDCDPQRPVGISSTDAEKLLAKELAAVVRKHLTDRGWPKPIPADSGNGYHLLYLIDLPNDDAARDLIESVLKALAARFDSESTKIDQKVFNASRICKVYGTVVRKGDHYICKSDPARSRPYRVAMMFQPPDPLAAVTLEQLQAVAAEAPKADPKKKKTNGKSTGPWTQELVEQLLTHGQIEYRKPTTWRKTKLKWQHACLTNPEHKCPDAFTVLDENGWISTKCSHNSCGDGLNAKQLVERIEEVAGEPFPLPTGAEWAWVEADDDKVWKHHYHDERGDIFSDDGQTWFDAQGSQL